jgi:hypothetical protein
VAPPDTRTARPAAPLQIPEDAPDDPDFAEGDEDVVLGADAPAGHASRADDEANAVAPVEDEISDQELVDAEGPAEKPAPKKRAARPRAKKKTDD